MFDGATRAMAALLPLDMRRLPEALCHTIHVFRHALRF